MEKIPPREQEDSMIFQIERFISFYDVYLHICTPNLKFSCHTSEQLSEDNTLILLFSNLYMLFDNHKNAQSLKDVVFIDKKTETLRKEILEDWSKIEKGLKIIRNNLGFHTSKNIEGQKIGAQQFQYLDKKPFELIQKLIKLYKQYKYKITYNRAYTKSGEPYSVNKC